MSSVHPQCVSCSVRSCKSLVTIWGIRNSSSFEKRTGLGIQQLGLPTVGIQSHRSYKTQAVRHCEWIQNIKKNKTEVFGSCNPRCHPKWAATFSSLNFHSNFSPAWAHLLKKWADFAHQFGAAYTTGASVLAMAAWLAPAFRSRGTGVAGRWFWYWQSWKVRFCWNSTV